MTEDHPKQENYLSKAKEAEEMAQKARNAVTRAAWIKIAQNYRVLASHLNSDKDSRALG